MCRAWMRREGRSQRIISHGILNLGKLCSDHSLVRHEGNSMRLISAIATTIAIFFYSLVLRAESVYVKYRDDVDLRFFDCWEITRSSFIKRVCYDWRNKYMLISVNGTFYQYCEIDAGTVSSLLSAPSIERFYNARIKGQFDCRVHRVPEY